MLQWKVFEFQIDINLFRHIQFLIGDMYFVVPGSLVISGMKQTKVNPIKGCES